MNAAMISDAAKIATLHDEWVQYCAANKIGLGIQAVGGVAILRGPSPDVIDWDFGKMVAIIKGVRHESPAI